MLVSNFEAHRVHGEAAMLAHRLGERTRRGAAVAAMAAASLRGHQFERALNESRRAIARGAAGAAEEIVGAGR